MPEHATEVQNGTWQPITAARMSRDLLLVVSSWKRLPAAAAAAAAAAAVAADNRKDSRVFD
jgi:hypothetical protein